MIEFLLTIAVTDVSPTGRRKMYARRRIKDRGTFAERSVQLLPSFDALRYPFFSREKRAGIGWGLGKEIVGAKEG